MTKHSTTNHFVGEGRSVYHRVTGTGELWAQGTANRLKPTNGKQKHTHEKQNQNTHKNKKSTETLSMFFFNIEKSNPKQTGASLVFYQWCKCYVNESEPLLPPENTTFNKKIRNYNK